MRVKRFVGDTVAETMGQVKRELGSDAVILQTRQIKEGGILGLFGKPKVEVMAAIEEEPVTKKPVAKPSYPANPYNNQRTASLAPDVPLDIKIGAKEDKRTLMESERLPEFSLKPEYGHKPEYGLKPEYAIKPEPSVKNAEISVLEAELQSMRKLLESMNRQMEKLDGEQGVWPVPLQKWADLLRERGISPQLIKRLLRTVQQEVREEDWPDEERVRASIRGSIRQICSKTAAIQPGVLKPRVVALIGPTGVGKTTTIGKLAAGFSIVDKRRVALITADTYRVAAVDQLKTFGEIIGVPVEVVMTPSSLKEAIARHQDKELIFIDTAGRSPHHELHMSELRAFLEKAQPDLTMLVMSAATQAADLAKIYERFANFTTHLVLTKMDETVCGGTILSLLDRTELPVAYITNGQNVPDDIEVATPERLTRYILGEED